MQKQNSGSRSIFSSTAFSWLSALAAGLFVFYSAVAAADPPSRVARIGYMSGAVTFSPAGEDDWVRASMNRPMTTGDRVWTDARSRAEVQMGGAMLRLSEFTGMSLLNLDDQTAQIQLTQGVVSFNVRYLEPGQIFEVDTPNLAFVVRDPGQYRIEVDPDADATTIVVRRGEGEAYGDNNSYIIDTQQPYRFTGTSLRDYQYVGAPRPDEFETWAVARDRTYDNSVSARYVSADVIGYQDLDANGSWRTDPAYGNVWYPSRVPAGWAPYRDGHWAWIDPWGWTWVDDAPWGFAVSHYGRWANARNGWCWVPGPYVPRGPRAARVYYAPALVGFVGGSNFQVTVASRNVGAVGWFPLGPREVYRPSYTVSRGYFENINRSNTVVNTTVINNYYNNTNVTNVVYANRGNVIAVPTTAFVQSQPVARAIVQLPRDTRGNDFHLTGPVAFTAPVAPTERSVRGPQPQASAPPPNTFQRPVVARTAPPPIHAGFAAQQQQLAAHPGLPLDDAARRQVRPVATAPAPVVNVIAQPPKTPPTVRPPGAGPDGRPGEGGPGRGRPDDRKGPPPIPPGATAPAPAAGQPPRAVLPGSAATLPQNAGVPIPGQPQTGQPQGPQPPANRNEPRRPDAREDQRGPRNDPRAPQQPPAVAVPPQQQASQPPAGMPATQPVTPTARLPGAANAPVTPQEPRDNRDSRDPRRNRGETQAPPAPPAPQAPATAPMPPQAAPQPQTQGQSANHGQRDPQPNREERAPRTLPPAQPAQAPKPPEEPRQPPPQRERAPEVAPRPVQPRPEHQEQASRPAPEQRAQPQPQPKQEQAHEVKPPPKPAAKPEETRNEKEKEKEKGKRDEENRKQKD